MNYIFLLFFLVGLLIGQHTLSEHLKPLERFVGKTWKGKMGEKDGKVTYDVAKWERALNGNAIRILHSLNEGEYGGETMIVWDIEKQSLIFYYFTTEGFYTHGTMKMEGAKLISHEKVTGNKEGITEVKSIGRILENGKLHNSSQYLKHGKWVDGHEFLYEESPQAVLIFK